MKKLKNKGVSTVFGSILFIILVVTLASILFFTLYRYNQNVQEAIKIEGERTQERIVLCALATENASETGPEYVTAIFINNTGSITSRIRAIYIDDQFICDPSKFEGDAYINPQESLWILMPAGIRYEPTAKLAVATERGIKSIEYEWKLKKGGPNPPPAIQRFYFGPLMLDFNKFYYTECNSDGSYDPSTWKPGWSVEKGSGSIVWNITVKNVDDRNITINQFSCFTLVPNDEPAERRPWYIEPDDTGQFPYTDATTQFIASNETVYIIYKWKTPKMKQMSPQSIYNTVCRNKVFLTFFGVFHEHDGTTKPYGQTIPFESVLVRLQSMEISATPTTIAANSTMTATITVIIRNTNGDPAANEQVSFTTDLGTLSDSTGTTNANGIATVTLYPSTLPGTAHVTATWKGTSKSTTVTIAEGTVQVSSSPATISANSTMNSTITAGIYLGGNPVANVQVGFTTDAGTLSSSSATTNPRGIATVTLYPSTEPERANITAIWEGLSNSTTVNIVEGTFGVSASPDTILANSSMNSTIMASVHLDGNPVSNAQVIFATDLGALSSSSETTDANGIATVTLYPSASPGIANVTATWEGLTQKTTVIINAAPVALFTESTESVIIGEDISFNAADSYDPDGTIVSYFWDFGDNTNATGATVVHAYTSEGVYNVTLTVTDDRGATASATATKTVYSTGGG